ncbi:MAG: hypothetical protein QOF62_3948 [Pyrinomonadaceae bacterium]|jgi:hypothetical protein|nr:hypothetical protein [Pyrinomonadaceae bacterium]
MAVRLRCLLDSGRKFVLVNNLSARFDCQGILTSATQFALAITFITDRPAHGDSVRFSQIPNPNNIELSDSSTGAQTRVVDQVLNPPWRSSKTVGVRLMQIITVESNLRRDLH